MKKAIVLPAVVLSSWMILGGLGVSQAEAFWPFDGLSKSNTNQAVTNSKTPTFLDRLIEKFNLNKDEVEQVVTDYRTERQSTMEAQFETRLIEAVTAGKLTEAQKTLILQKHEELQSQHEQDFQNRQTHREELEKWAVDNGIDVSYFGGGRNGEGRGGMMGEGRGMGRGMHW